MANDLPVIRKANGIYEPNPVAIFTVGKKTIASSTRINTTNPNWVIKENALSFLVKNLVKFKDENYFFLVENPENEVLNLKIHDNKNNQKICSLFFNLNELLNQNKLSIERQFSFDSHYSAKVTMGLSLKVLIKEIS